MRDVFSFMDIAEEIFSLANVSIVDSNAISNLEYCKAICHVLSFVYRMGFIAACEGKDLS